MTTIYLSLLILACAVHCSCGLGFHWGNGYKVLLETLRRRNPIVHGVDTRWIDQPLDHFDTNETRVWKMRYFERLDLWKPGGPLIIFVGGEAEANPGILMSGMIVEFAKETNGALLMSEHRYYGKSIPLNYTGVESLKYLNSRQALADIANLIKWYKDQPSYAHSKVVVIGGSYPGSLAAWMRLLYPIMVDAAIASSAPVLAKVDFYEYLETVTDVYRKYGGEKCYKVIKNKFQRYSDLLKTEKGIDTLKMEVNICTQSNMSKPENQFYFMLIAGYHYMGNAQYGTVDGIKADCEMNHSSSAASYQNQFPFDTLDVLNQDNCVDINYDAQLRQKKEDINEISWWYQKCTEFGYFKTTKSTKQIFSHNLSVDFFYKLCIDLFGEDYGEDNIKKSVNYTNTLYGGLHPDVDKVIFVNGELDPWHRLGIVKDLSNNAPAKFIPRSSHCSDLYPQNENDPNELIEARKYIIDVIKSWIGIGNTDRNA